MADFDANFWCDSCHLRPGRLSLLTLSCPGSNKGRERARVSPTNRSPFFPGSGNGE